MHYVKKIKMKLGHIKFFHPSLKHKVTFAFFY